jgi:hypothetical protein
MTRDQLIALLPHLPEGTEIQFNFKLEGAAGASAPAGGEAPVPAPRLEQPDRLKLKDASTRYGVPERELKRAVARGFLPFTTKETGRDAQAHMVAPADLERYVARRERIRAFREPRPENWSGPGGGR